MVRTARIKDRRDVHFSSMSEILDDVEYLASGDPPRTTGNWTPGQIVQHVAKLVNYSIDGFPVPKASLPFRILGRMMRRRALENPLRPGFSFPRKFTFLAPDDGVTWDEAVGYMNETVARLSGHRMSAPSPVLGRLTHEQWEQLHCRHAEMHFSFMHPA